MNNNMTIDPQTGYQTEFFECACHSDEHTLKFNLDTMPSHEDAPEIYTSIFLCDWQPWYKRVWVAIKYAFGYKSKYGHWDTWLLKACDVDRLEAMLNKFKELHTKYENRLDNREESNILEK